MDYNVGDVVVYPHHGAATIAAHETRQFKGQDVEYLVLEIQHSDLTVRVPLHNAENIGVREVVGDAGLKKLFGVLRETDVEESGNWSRRYKANQERLSSGDINKVAEVIRDLWRRDQDRGLSAGEKRMLSKARHILVGELALAKTGDDAKAEPFLATVNEAIARLNTPATADPDHKLAGDADPADMADLSFDDE